MKVLLQKGDLTEHLVKAAFHLVRLTNIAAKRCYFAIETGSRK
jgi:hypothetical protein